MLTEKKNALERSPHRVWSHASHQLLPNAKIYWRFNVGDGCPGWIPAKDDKGGQWVLKEQRQEQALGELDDVAAMDKTIKATEVYIGQRIMRGFIADCAQALVESA